MKENENKEPPVTEADLARVAAVRCECGNPKCPTNVASDIARELAAARAAIKVKDEALARSERSIAKLVERLKTGDHFEH